MILGALGIAYGFLTIPNSIEDVKQLTEQQNQEHNEANAADVIEQNANNSSENNTGVSEGTESEHLTHALHSLQNRPYAAIFIAMFFFLPFFGQRVHDGIEEVSLLALDEIQLYRKAAYFTFVCLAATLGVMTLALQNWQKRFWVQKKYILSVVLGVAGVCLFVISQQPYAAIFTFAFLIIKVFLLIKQ